MYIHHHMTQITLLPNINSPMKYHCPGIISRMFTVTNEVQKDQAFPPVHQYTPNESESRSVMSDFLWPHGLYSPWNSLVQNTGVGSLSLFQGIFPDPGIEPRSPTLQADSLPAGPQGKPKNTGVGSLFLRQQIFPTQESNLGLLHCRQILYQLSYQGSH